MSATEGLNSYSHDAEWGLLLFELATAETSEAKKLASAKLFAFAFDVPVEMVYRPVVTPTPTPRETTMEAKLFCEECETGEWVSIDEYDHDRLRDCTSDDHVEDYSVVKLDGAEEVTEETTLFDLPCSYPDLLKQIDAIESIPDDYYWHDLIVAWLENSGGTILDLRISDFEDSYYGTFYDTKEFAQEFAESIGAVDHDTSWPNNCIDWDKAAAELMYDFWSADVSTGVAIFRY